MDGILNEYTETVHKHETGRPVLHTECGVTHNLSADQLEVVSVEQAATEYSKCGRCFEDGGSY
jgi:hypothetical protein